MSPDPVALEAATLADLPALVALEARCHSHPWSEKGLLEALRPEEGQRALLVLRAPWTESDVDRGIRAYCAFQVVAGEAHIHNLAVAPEARRRGLARLLLARVLEIAARRGARIVHLEVRSGNAAARALYGGMGFREAGSRRAYYAAPVEDAVLLSREDPETARPVNLERPPAKC